MSEEKETVRVFPVALFPEITNPYPWQRQVIDICSRVPTTTCHWYYGPIIGKSSLVRHLLTHYKAQLASTPSHVRAILAKTDCKILIIHPTYANRTRIPYAEISNAIDGAMIATRKGTVVRAPVHVFVISNHPPDTKMLSDWKWHIQNITSTDQVPDPY